MKRFLILLCSVACLLSSARAAEPAELAPGLRYLRIHSLVQSALELNNALNLNQSPALIIDLRYIDDEKDAAQAINALNNHPAKPVLYILVSPETPAEVAAVIAKSSTPLVTLGIRGSKPEPEVVVEQSAADDRRAYDALAAGTPLADLISGKVEKERFDEASLVHEFKNGNHDAHPPETPAGAKTPPAKLVDRVLQRATQLHRALLALKPRG